MKKAEPPNANPRHSRSDASRRRGVTKQSKVGSRFCEEVEAEKQAFERVFGLCRVVIPHNPNDYLNDYPNDGAERTDFC